MCSSKTREIRESTAQLMMGKYVACMLAPAPSMRATKTKLTIGLLSHDKENRKSTLNPKMQQAHSKMLPHMGVSQN